MKNSRTRIYAQSSKNGLDIYLDISGKDYYLTTHRPNENIWRKLKDGTSLGELRRIKPKKCRAEQKYHHYVSHLLKITDDFINYELVA
jgi:hypothetical protein